MQRRNFACLLMPKFFPKLFRLKNFRYKRKNELGPKGSYADVIRKAPMLTLSERLLFKFYQKHSYVNAIRKAPFCSYNMNDTLSFTDYEHATAKSKSIRVSISDYEQATTMSKSTRVSISDYEHATAKSKSIRVPGYMQSKGARNRGPLGDREIRYKCSMQNTILDVLRARPGWQEVSGGALQEDVYKPCMPMFLSMCVHVFVCNMCVFFVAYPSPNPPQQQQLQQQQQQEKKGKLGGKRKEVSQGKEESQGKEGSQEGSQKVSLEVMKSGKSGRKEVREARKEVRKEESQGKEGSQEGSQEVIKSGSNKVREGRKSGKPGRKSGRKKVRKKGSQGSQEGSHVGNAAGTGSGSVATGKSSSQNSAPSNQLPTTTSSRSSEGDWDFHWCDREWLHANYDTMFLQEHQKILHFRNHYELTRKNLMVKNLKRLRKQTEREMGKKEAESFDFYPTTYELPSEYHIFVEEFKKNQGIIWIMKPAAKSQGRGIFLFRKLKDITDWKKGEYQPLTDPNREVPETYVVQRYIEDPYLIGGRKFDIRVYVLVVSARRVFQGIDNIIIKSLQSVQKIIINDKHCFEMYGYDVLLDDKLKPWLIEINASPSLTASGKDDYDLKHGVLNDVLNVLDLENRLTGKEKRVGGFDLIWDDGAVTTDDGAMECSVNSVSTTSNSFLGCHCDRKKHLREIYTAAQALKKSTPS
ncbi:TTLL9-like protein [Mya arenaria]|uniref:Tubulin--tyrosine ligase-like protein 9 n=1 Tax=Mya arenaria TaxID=6604 RepID=A0ABY7ET01_MYAAR|nr:TTLL9-like protein [Mya arenaria]